MTNAAPRLVDSTGDGSPPPALERARRRWLRGDSAGAIGMLARMVSAADPNPDAVFFLVDALIEAGRPEDAHTVLKRLPSAVDDRGRLYSVRADVALGRMAEADAALDRFLTDHPDDAAALTVKAEIAASRNDGAGVHQWTAAALDADPAHAGAWQLKGRLAEAAGDTTAAASCFVNAFRSNPLATGVAADFHRCIGALGGNREYTELFIAMADHHPESRQLAFFAIDMLLRDERYSEALDRIRSAMARFGADDGVIDAGLAVQARLDHPTPPTHRVPATGISLVVIARDEQVHLSRCLASVQTVVDEIVVVDTGSRDRTAAVARLFNARLVTHPWTDDFAAARNAGIAAATGRWILSLDADECISASDHEPLVRLATQTPPGTAAFSIVTRNYLWEANAIGWTANTGDYPAEAAGSGWFPSRKVRLFPNIAGIGFAYPVHELVEPSLQRHGIPVRKCPIPVHHYGKLDAARSREKGERYYAIGMAKLARMADDPTALRELAVQALNLGHTRDAVNLWMRLARQDPADGEIQVNLGTALFNAGDYKKALACARSAATVSPAMKEAWFNAALATLHLGDAAGAAAMADTVATQWPTYLSAQFLAAAAACGAGAAGGAEALSRLAATAIGQTVFAAVDTLEASLNRAGQGKIAERLRCAADAVGIRTPVSEPSESHGGR